MDERTEVKMEGIEAALQQILLGIAGMYRAADPADMLKGRRVSDGVMVGGVPVYFVVDYIMKGSRLALSASVYVDDGIAGTAPLELQETEEGFALEVHCG
jgi:hypothetical protein